MDLGSLLIAVSASGASGTVFLVSFIVYHGLWTDIRSLDSSPNWFFSKKLLACGILKLKASSEVYKRSFGENCMLFIALSYILLGLINFGAGLYSIILLNSIRDGTCQYAWDMGNRCKPSNCSTPCGSPSFFTCGVVVCDRLRCSADVSAFLRIAGDSSATSAADTFSTLQGSLTVVQVCTFSSCRIAGLPPPHRHPSRNGPTRGFRPLSAISRHHSPGLSGGGGGGGGGGGRRWRPSSARPRA
jgi:hypothetical protein